MTAIAIAQPEISFEKTRHDFGIVEEGKKAAYEFQFTNTGDDTLKISSVRASCGCTTPYWTKEPVPPGASGSIKASYNSRNRPGNFHKNVTVKSNAVNQQTQRLYIKGIVIKKPDKEPTAEEKAQSPKIKLSRNSVDFGKVEKGQSVETTITLSNTGKQPLNIKDVKSSCYCVNIQADDPVAPGASKDMRVIYTPRHTGNGPETAVIMSNDITQSHLSLTIHADVVKSLASPSIIQQEQSNVPFK